MQPENPKPLLRVIRRDSTWCRIVFDIVRLPDGLLSCCPIDDYQPDIVFKFLDGGELRGVGASARAAPTPRPLPSSSWWLF